MDDTTQQKINGMNPLEEDLRLLLEDLPASLEIMRVTDMSRQGVRKYEIALQSFPCQLPKGVAFYLEAYRYDESPGWAFEVVVRGRVSEEPDECWIMCRGYAHSQSDIPVLDRMAQRVVNAWKAASKP
jgi:hypothetical protein